MSDISKIRIEGVSYTIKDDVARKTIENFDKYINKNTGEIVVKVSDLTKTESDYPTIEVEDSLNDIAGKVNKHMSDLGDDLALVKQNQESVNKKVKDMSDKVDNLDDIKVDDKTIKKNGDGELYAVSKTEWNLESGKVLFTTDTENKSVNLPYIKEGSSEWTKNLLEIVPSENGETAVAKFHGIADTATQTSEALTFTGNVTGTWNGNEAKTVDIPDLLTTLEQVSENDVSGHGVDALVVKELIGGLTKEEADEMYASKSIYGDEVLSLGRTEHSVIGSTSIVAGGELNSASGNCSVVVGGKNNCTEGHNSAVIGGNNNNIKYNGSGASAIIASALCEIESSGISAILGSANSDIDSSDSYQMGVILGGNYAKGIGHAVVLGHYNDTSLGGGTKSIDPVGTGTQTALEIGNGTASASSNAIRMDYNGKIWCKASYSATGADYAELFEWEDENPNNENRIGYFVTMQGKKIRKANKGDWILGIVSANPCVLGNSDMEWQGQFMRDEFNNYIIEHHKEIITEIDPETGEEVEKEIEYDFYKVNPDYDPDKPYIDRISRPEWDAVGMMGVLPVWDDGTCKVNGFCSCGDDGIATSSDTGYRVIERVAENIIEVIMK